MEPKHPDDLAYEAIEKKMGWGDPTRVASVDFGTDDKTVVAFFKIERNEQGEPIEVTRLHVPPWYERFWLWLMRLTGR